MRAGAAFPNAAHLVGPREPKGGDGAYAPERIGAATRQGKAVCEGALAVVGGDVGRLLGPTLQCGAARGARPPVAHLCMVSTLPLSSGRSSSR